MNPSEILPVHRSGPAWKPGDAPLSIAVLGSTGSVGTQVLDVLRSFPDRFRVAALTAGANVELLAAQTREFQPELIVATDESIRSTDLPKGTRIEIGKDALIEAATLPDVDIVVTATSGHAAIVPTARAIEAGKTIALANKETIVCAAEIIMPLAQQHNVAIRPVDSEHSAIWQALGGSDPHHVARLILTASGGPFRDYTTAQMDGITVEMALNHPTWSMGGKITIDSATLMNKGLEVIEAHWLFGLPYEQIDVLVHPESIIHSIVEFADYSQIAQLGLPDMRLPIQYALTYPDHAPGPCKRLSLADIGALHFAHPDEDRFPCLRLAREAGNKRGPYPAILSTADEIAVQAFMAGSLSFAGIARTVDHALASYSGPESVTLESLAEIDAWTRTTTLESITRIIPTVSYPG
ncbi:MAG: 1-deoxy-D-xylulose-5-phosphate reductoisomerase [Thermomicrobiales bacterium]